jgi:hypothetical protein
MKNNQISKPATNHSPAGKNKLVGKFFHLITDRSEDFAGVANYLGQIIEYLGEGIYRIEFFEWISGSVNFGSCLCRLEDYLWTPGASLYLQIYDTAEEMKEAYEVRWEARSLQHYEDSKAKKRFDRYDRTDRSAKWEYMNSELTFNTNREKLPCPIF